MKGVIRNGAAASGSIVLSDGNEPDGRAVSHGRRLQQLARERPEATAITMVHADGSEATVSWGELERESNRTARRLVQLGARAGSMVAVVLPNSIDHYVVDLAVWKVGACVLPLNHRAPMEERQALLDLARPSLAITAPLGNSDGASDAALDDVVSTPGLAIGTGGSTGRPKIVVDPNPWARVPGEVAWLEGWAGLRPDQVQLVPGPLYHNAPFNWSHRGLFQGNHLVVMERFDAALALGLIERHRVNFAFMVPTMMGRIARIPGVEERDLSSIHAVFHSGAPCPPWVKTAWIDLVGPGAVREAFGATELVGVAVIDGEEWLEHPGSVGRPFASEIKILDESGVEVPVGEVGEIFMRRTDVSGPTYAYIGAARAKSTADDFQSVGDLGWLDDAGYLYVADRRVDMIITGGANVYPAEVEAALSEHPAVADVVVVGVPHEDWGKAVHAIVQPADGSDPPAPDELTSYCRERLAPYKVPKSYEIVERLPRNEAGKLRRSALVENVRAARDDGRAGSGLA